MCDVASVIEPHQTKAPVIGSTFTVIRSPLRGISVMQKVSPKKESGKKGTINKIAMSTALHMKRKNHFSIPLTTIFDVSWQFCSFLTKYEHMIAFFSKIILSLMSENG